jgi:hypothetical protein
MKNHTSPLRTLIFAGTLALIGNGTHAQTSATPAPQSPTPAGAPTSAAAPLVSTPVDTKSLAPLAWLEGCWRGAVNQREFREHWLPLRGGLLIGASQNVMQDKTVDYEYLRIELRSDGVHYIAMPNDKPPADFRLVTASTDERGTQFNFTNVADEYPQKLVYHRGGEGWLYATIDGKLNGEPRQVTFPMRRINCETGDPIRQ